MKRNSKVRSSEMREQTDRELERENETKVKLKRTNEEKIYRDTEP